MKKTAFLFLTVILLLFVCLVSCDNCNDTPEQGHKHILDDAGICTVCGQPISDTEGIIYELSDDGSYAMVVGYNGTATKIKIAESYQGVPVKEIYRDSFKHNDIITSVVIPDSVTTIGYYALSNCDSLTSIVFGDSVTTIVHYAFADCDSLTSVIIPESVTTIGMAAFYACDNLSSVVFGDNVTTIGAGAFKDCNLTFTEYDNCKYLGNGDNPYYVLIEATDKNLSYYSIHSDTVIIAGNAFGRCGNLKSIEIPDNVVVISDSAFEYCRSLTSVIIGRSVTTIDDDAFLSCTDLASVVIPDSVTTIGISAFMHCYGLKNVYYTGSKEAWDKISIGAHNSNLTAKVSQYHYVSEK